MAAGCWTLAPYPLRANTASDPSRLRTVLYNAHSDVVGTQAMVDAGLDPAVVESALAAGELETVTLDPSAEERTTRGTIAFVGALILYGQLIGYSQYMQSVYVTDPALRIGDFVPVAISGGYANSLAGEIARREAA